MANSKIHILLFFAIILYPVSLIFQGIDFTDFGFWISNYSLVFKYPEDISDLGYLSYLSLILGNLALKITPFPGPFNAKFAWALVILTNVSVVFHLCKPHFKKTTILISILLAEIFLLQKSTNWISYNDLSGLCHTIILFFAVKSFTNSSSKSNWIFLGIFCAAGYWIRFPNILNLSIAALTVFVIRKDYLKHTLLCLGGYILFHIVILTFMYFSQNLDPYLTALFEGLNMSSENKSAHNSSKLLMKLFRDFYKSGTFAIVILSLTILCGKIYSKFISNKTKFKKYSLLLLLTFFFFFLLKNPGFQILRIIGFQHEYTILLTLITIFVYPIIKENKTLLFYFAVSLIVLYITPMGSTVGMGNSYFAAYPVVIGLISLYLSKKEIPWPRGINIPHYFVLVALISGVYVSIKRVYNFKYRDEGPRSLYIHSPGGSFKGLFTRAERAQSIKEFEIAIKDYISSDDILLEINNIPMAFFLSQARPYLGTTWSHSITSQKFISIFKENIQKGIYPDAVVRPLYTARSHYWPLDEGFRKPKARDLPAIEFSNKWLIDNNYKVVWKNDFFEILKPII